MTIWKFPLALTDRQVISMPEGATVLHVAVQNDQICLWAAVEPSADLCLVAVEIRGTGHSLPKGTHLGSVLMGQFVWHVFEVDL